MTTYNLFNISFNSSANGRVDAAFERINKAIDKLDAKGYIFTSKGKSSGRSGTFPVRDLDTGVEMFRVRYMKGPWFVGASAMAEEIADKLEEMLATLN